ncbi:MAG: tetratricopeptide repeat protein [Drouetiella hepatica Uher 2000/2452]|jgi:tetratricopeptide (TPR) repeat protein|uniref:Tetratricopeptide repeat protein n=1 Tax=Drouetiella hepatica Uher 2000/2452 TaxID=904376 RepID=A0A951QBH8_9CYAN|nr:tetratricopeptide repeat protein [Drouetiella hepatica Uher 2000/2452]
MPDVPSLSDRYLTLIDQIVQMTLKGQIRSKEQVFQMLQEGVDVGTGEIFERCLGDRLTVTQQQADSRDDELKQAKATRSLRALQTIRGEWERWQTQNQVAAVLDTALRQMATADDRLNVFLRVTDPNLPKPLNLAQLQQLAKELRHQESQPSAELQPEVQQELQQISQGVTRGLESWSRLENHLVSWIYDQSQGQLGFGGAPGDRGPWMAWAKQANGTLKSLFQALALGQSPVEWVRQQSGFGLSDFVEIAVVLRCLQQGLVNWFDKLVYDSKVGAKLSISTFLGFAVTWSQLANGFGQAVIPRRDRLVNGCFQMTLQILRVFAQRSYFPLYGNIFASFSGEYLRDALSYLDEPLRQEEGTQEKARILTLLGSSMRALGQSERAIDLHQQALDIARTAADTACEIANLNHLSRACVAQSSYAEAINYSQRAVILSRQKGDRLGEANALANLGYSEVFQAQQLEQTDPDRFEMAIDRLQQGLELSEKLGDRQSQALCLSSLGIAQILIEAPQEAIGYLEKGIQSAQVSGDVYLQGQNLAYLAEAYYRLQNPPQAVQMACLGMYLLEQIGSVSWRQPAGLLTVLRGQLGKEAFDTLLKQKRSEIIAAIGVDGYDHLPDLLELYSS